MADPTGTKLDAIRMILRRYPEWREGDLAVRIDNDGEVVSRTATEITGVPAHNSHGYATGPGRRLEYEDRAEWFVPARNFQKEGMIGYSFDRFEYEVYRAAILAEKESETTT